MKITLQLALDFLNLKRAIQLAEEAVKGGVTWIEAGTPLIKSDALDPIREPRKHFPHPTILADLETMVVGSSDIEASPYATPD